MGSELTDYIRARTRVAADEKAQTLTEYALIIGVVAVALVVALGLISGSLTGFFTTLTSTLAGA